MKKNIIIETICFLFIVLFVYAATSKVIAFHEFEIQIGQSPLLTNYSYLLAWVVPLLEIIISVMLAFRSLRTIGLYASFSIMVIFTSYIVVILNFSNHIPCSCGGILQKMSWNDHLIFNIVFCFLALSGILFNESIVNHNIETSKV